MGEEKLTRTLAPPPLVVARRAENSPRPRLVFDSATLPLPELSRETTQLASGDSNGSKTLTGEPVVGVAVGVATVPVAVAVGVRVGVAVVVGVRVGV